ncbi:MAG: hypothetical protein H7Y11_00760 [Armatimonadetes bacterium]|nr:hypothetical protein [Anaerolineae bacterium]
MVTKNTPGFVNGKTPVDFCLTQRRRDAKAQAEKKPESVWGWKISGICLPSFATGAAWKDIEGWKSMMAATVSFRLFSSDVVFWMRESSLERVAFTRERRNAQ